VSIIRVETPVLSAFLADFRIIFERDPAARNWLEVLFCYPGLQALLLHRICHWLYYLGIPLIPRLISQFSRFLTGVEIHPGAQIGKGVFIDHGMGVVIGETAIIGDYTLIYQGVTLGGTGKECGKRHPTLGENVVVGAGAKVLGNIQIGNNVRIGAGSVVLRDVPSDCTVVGVPGRIIYRSGVRVDPLEHGNLPDSEATVIRALVDRIETLEQNLQELLSQQPMATASLVHAIPSRFETPDSFACVADCCHVRDKAIQEFFDGSGI
jgi:serine O-acetyltransferase